MVDGITKDFFLGLSLHAAFWGSVLYAGSYFATRSQIKMAKRNPTEENISEIKRIRDETVRSKLERFLFNKHLRLYNDFLENYL